MVSKTINVILGVLAVFSAVEAQVGIPCHSSFFQFTSRHSLNISEYMGDWYVHEIAGSDIGNFPVPSYKCAKRNLRLNNTSDDPPNLFAVDSTVNINDGITVTKSLQVSVNATRSPLNSLWTMTEQGPNGPVTSDVVILFADLDFKEWTVVYSCSILAPDSYRYEVLMAMSRNREISYSTRRTLKALMVGQGFRIGDHHPIDQTNC